MRQLSGGMKRRVLVAQALVHRPPVIVLDEPTAGVDVELRQTLWQFIARLNKEGHTVLLTTHYLGGSRGPVSAHRHAEGRPHRRAGPHLAAAGRHGVDDAALQDRRGAAAGHCGACSCDGPHRAGHAHDAGEVETTLAALRLVGCPVEDLEIGRADLEDVFLEIMQGEHA